MSTIDKIRAEMAKRATATGNDAKFFTTNRKGENHELREELRNPQRDRKRDAVKKVIANMTVGKDVSQLFPDVINFASLPVAVARFAISARILSMVLMALAV